MARRILSLWFPRLAAERVLRQRRDTLPMPFATVQEQSRALVLTSLNPLAEMAGLSRGQPLRDAAAMCPGLLTAVTDPQTERAFLGRLQRWRGNIRPGSRWNRPSLW